MTDNELIQIWYDRMFRSNRREPAYLKRRFFCNFREHFDEALAASGVSIDDLKTAELEGYRPEPSMMRDALVKKLESLRIDFQQREYRGGSGQGIKDGSRRDVMKVNQPNRGRWNADDNR